MPLFLKKTSFLPLCVLVGMMVAIHPAQALQVFDVTSANTFNTTTSQGGQGIGSSVSGIGDIDADGFEDFLVTASGDDVGVGSSSKGAAYLYYGTSRSGGNNTVMAASNSVNTPTNAAARFVAVANIDHFGTYSVGNCNFNNDAYADFVIASPDTSAANNGTVYVFLGKSSRFSGSMTATAVGASTYQITGETSGDQIGTLSCGDINNDGYDDLTIGVKANDRAGTNVGTVYVELGNNLASESLANADMIITGNPNGSTGTDAFGSDVDATGDINNDGYNDIVITAPNSDLSAAGTLGANVTNSGAVYVYYGSSSPASSMTYANADATIVRGTFSNNIAKDIAVGDYNNDSYDDLAIGAGFALTTHAAVGIVYGGATGSTYGALTSTPSTPTDLGTAADVFITGIAADSAGDATVATATDVNGDTIQDLVIGLPSLDYSGTVGSAGGVFLFYGKTSGTALSGTVDMYSADIEIRGLELDDLLGSNGQVSSVDSNGDGFSEILLGDSFHNVGAAGNVGIAYLAYLYFDKDTDGLAGPSAAAGTGALLSGTDCDDTNSGVSAYTYYLDNDGDTLGDPNESVVSCSSSVPTGYVTNNSDTAGDSDFDNDGYEGTTWGGTDCDDGDVAVHAYKTLYKDGDGDGARTTTTRSFCTVSSSASYNGDVYIESSAVVDCNDNDSGVTVVQNYYADEDGDGYHATSPITYCSVASSVVISTITYYSNPLPAETAGDHDFDNDGYDGATWGGADCDDNASSVHATKTFYLDADSDGARSSSSSQSFCSAASTYYAAPYTYYDSSAATDCNDGDATVTANQTYYRDVDGDTLGSAASTTSVCSSSAPSGYVTNTLDSNDNDYDNDGYVGSTWAGSDCNDANNTIFATYYQDADGDTFGTSAVTNCSNGTTPSGYVTNYSDANDHDFDNDGVTGPTWSGTDCNDSNNAVFTTYYVDVDGDTFGNASVSSCAGSSAPTGYVAGGTDANDHDRDNDTVEGSTWGGSDCNDNNSSISANQTYYADVDGDALGNPASITSLCSLTVPSGYVANSSDSNDNDRDNDSVTGTTWGGSDCNDLNALLFTTYYVDADSDAQGDEAVTLCSGGSTPSGYVATHTDANDHDHDNDGVTGLTWSGSDCNDNDPALSTIQVYYADIDGDSLGDPNATTSLCSLVAPTGYVSSSGDVNDQDFDNDGIVTDSDCDDTNNAGFITYYQDADSDALGNPLVTICSGDTAPSGYHTDATDINDHDHDNDTVTGTTWGGTDCNDNDATVNSLTTFYSDLDSDGLGDPNNSTLACSLTAPTGYVANANDTNDIPSVHGKNSPYTTPADLTNPALYIQEVSSIVGAINGGVTVTYTDSEVTTYQVFAIKSKFLTTVKQYGNSGYILVLHPKGKKIGLLNPYTGKVIKTITLSIKRKYAKNSIKILDVRHDGTQDIVVTSKKKGVVLTSLLKLKMPEAKMTRKDSRLVQNASKVLVTKTIAPKKIVALRDARKHKLFRFKVTKKYKMKLL